jgi:hypothetical protein
MKNVAVVDRGTMGETFKKLARYLDQRDAHLKYAGKDRFQIVGDDIDDDKTLTPDELAKLLDD